MADLELIRHCVFKVLKTMADAEKNRPRQYSNQYAHFRSAVASKLDEISNSPDDFSNYHRKQMGEQLTLSLINEERLRVVFWSLIFQGIIVLGERGSTSTSGYPWFFLSEYGKECADKGTVVPHDQGHYLASLKTKIPDLDDTILFYLAESLQAFNYDLLTSAIITLGCASEKAFLILEEKYIQYLNRSNPSQAQKYERDVKGRVLKRKYDEFKKRFHDIKHSYEHANGTDERLDFIDTIFNVIRLNRNDAGHPSGKLVDRAVVYSNLSIFHTYCEAVYKLINFFDTN